MITAGLTGGSGAGKSTVAQVFSEMGIAHIDGDAVSREVTRAGSPCLAELTEAFGPEILLPDGSLNRRALGALVFGNPERLPLLNKITHQHILARIREKLDRLEASGEKAAVVDAAALIESGFYRECVPMVAVIAPERLRAGRISRREGISRKDAMTRIKAQPPDEFYISHSQLIIRNDGRRRSLIARAREAGAAILSGRFAGEAGKGESLDGTETKNKPV